MSVCIHKYIFNLSMRNRDYLRDHAVMDACIDLLSR